VRPGEDKRDTTGENNKGQEKQIPTIIHYLDAELCQMRHDCTRHQTHTQQGAEG
jgi:hypothetical protein